MFVVNQGSVDSRARLMVDGEVAPVGVPAKQVVLLFIYDQFLKRKTVLVKTHTHTYCNAFVPLSHNLTVLLPTEKLKSRG